MGILDRIWKTRMKDYTYGKPAQAPSDIPHIKISPNGSYLSVTLRSARIVDVRRGWNRFYPVVHSYASVPHRTGGLAEFQVVTSPSKLAELDPSNLDKIINLNHRLLGPTPYRGGDLNVEMGLVSVKSADLAKPFIGVLETMASAAGVSFVTTAKPFIEPLKKGLEMLFGSNELNLEIGLSTSWKNPETGYFFVIRAQRGTIKPSDLKVADDLRLVDRSGQSIGEYPYFVFSIEASSTRDDFFMIPEISEIYNEVQDAVRKGKRTQAEEAFAAFKRTALASPDLLSRDAQELVKKTGDELEIALPAAMTSRAERKIPPLQTMLYGGKRKIKPHKGGLTL